MKFRHLSKRAIQAFAYKAVSTSLLLSSYTSTILTASAMNMNTMLMAQPLEGFLSNLVSYGEIGKSQKQQILGMAGDYDEANDYRTDVFATTKSKDDLRAYLYAEVSEGELEQDSAESIASALSLGGLYPSANIAGIAEAGIAQAGIAQSVLANNPVQAVYNPSGEGNMVRLGRSKIFSSSGKSFHNGIWGYATGRREYALQCHGEGFAIIDVTEPDLTFRVQFVAMDGGGYWRDVATHYDSNTNKTYAYVGAQGDQGGGDKPNLFVFDLSYLSGDINNPNDDNSNPIPQGPEGYLDLGYTGMSHTLNVARGLLFLNSAGGGGTDGCNVYDITANPWDPSFLFNTGGSGRTCHDSFVREGIDGKDVLFISDGYGRRERIYDITNVNANWETGLVPPLLGQTEKISGIYAHESWLSEDNRYLFEFDENNELDIIVHDVSDLNNAIQIGAFQYSEEGNKNARPHNGEIRGNYFYVAYYQAGLRVFDISNPYLPVEVGKVETYRDPNGDGSYTRDITDDYGGAWNTYPYLPSRNVLVSDTDEGLFIVEAKPPYNAPNAPAVSISRDASDNILLNWNVVENARGYAVERSSDGTSYDLIAEHMVSLAYLDSSAPSTGVYYKVTAINGEGSGTSSIVTATVAPTKSPTNQPTKAPIKPTTSPTLAPTKSPTNQPTKSPINPTKPPTDTPTKSPTGQPSLSPTLPGICSDDLARRCSIVSECSCGTTAQPVVTSSSGGIFDRKLETCSGIKKKRDCKKKKASCIWVNNENQCILTVPATPGPSQSPTTKPTTSPTKQPTSPPTKSPTACACYLTAFPTTSPIVSTPKPTSTPTKAPIPSPTPSPVKCLKKKTTCPPDPKDCCSGKCKTKNGNSQCR